MKKLIMATSVCLCLTVANSAAETIDMNDARCSELFAGDETNAAMLLMWIDGWMAGRSDETAVDLDLFDSQMSRMFTYCEANPNEYLLDAAERIFPN